MTLEEYISEKELEIKDLKKQTQSLTNIHAKEKINFQTISKAVKLIKVYFR